MGMAWLMLLVAGAVEISFVLALGHPRSFKTLVPTALTLFLGGLSVYLLSVAMTDLPAGTAYAVWAAIGAGGGVTLGILLRGEPASRMRLGGLAVVLGGVVLLRLAEA